MSVPDETSTVRQWPDAGGRAVDISMFDDQLVIRPPARLGLDMTIVLVDAVDAALRGGATVMVDLDPETASSDLAAVGPVGSSPDVGATPRGPVVVLAPGCVRVPTLDGHWTIDVAASRMFRSDTPLDPSFVGPDDWTPIRALWLTCASLTALTDAGSYLSARTPWQRAPAPPARRR